jgi:hypothetical protein
LTLVIAGGAASTTALEGSTEQEQFSEIKHQARPKYGPDAACQAILGFCRSTIDVDEIKSAHGYEDELIPSGD